MNAQLKSTPRITRASSQALFDDPLEAAQTFIARRMVSTGHNFDTEELVNDCADHLVVRCEITRKAAWSIAFQVCAEQQSSKLPGAIDIDHSTGDGIVLRTSEGLFGFTRAQLVEFTRQSRACRLSPV